MNKQRPEKHWVITSAATYCVASLVCTGLLLSTGCRNDPTDGTNPALVTIPDEDKARLFGGKAPPVKKTATNGTGKTDPATVPDPKTAPIDDELLLATQKGPAGYSDQKVVEAFRNQCAVEQAAQGKKKVEPVKQDGADKYGRIWEGERLEPDFGPIPTEDIFVWTEGDAEYLDPNLISESAGNAISQQMFETLLISPPGNTEPRPGMAERYELSPDGRIYTFHIRKNVVWSDGTPLNAHDFKYSWLRGLKPETGSKNAQQLWYIKGAKDYNGGQNKDPESVGITVKDDHTLVVELGNPAAFFPHLLTYVAYAPVPKHIVEKYKKRWTMPENIVVNGPFTMTEWTPRAKVVFGKNEKYWDAANVKLKGSVVLLGDSSEKNLNYYKTGQAHAAKPVPPDQARQMVQNGRKDLKIDQLMCTYYYIMRMDKPPFDDPLVRRAINLAVDRETLTKQILGLFQVPATTLLPDMFEGTVGYKAIEGDDYNPTEAARLLAEAGYPGGRGIPPIELVYNTYESHRLIAVFVQRNLKENLGLEVTINNMEWKSLLKKQAAGDFQLARTSWCADYPDPLTFLTVFHSEGENNYAAYKNPSFDKLIDDIKGETDKTKRNISICAAEKVLNRDVPILPFYFYTRAYLLRSFVKGYDPHYQDHHLLKWISIDRSGGK